MICRFLTANRSLPEDKVLGNLLLDFSSSENENLEDAQRLIVVVEVMFKHFFLKNGLIIQFGDRYHLEWGGICW